MITAHFPSGYVTGRAFAHSGPVLWAAMLGGFLPDLDLIWFYFIDDRAFHHHHYWVHIPAFWAVLALVTFPILKAFKPTWCRAVVAFFAAILLHMCLDSVAGGVKWLWPFSDEFFQLVTVPAAQSHWILNFVLHPVFFLEIAIWATALFFWRQSRSSKTA